jgi:hypothetical protein
MVRSIVPWHRSVGQTAVAALLSIFAAASAAEAGSKDYCRNVQFRGSAGANPPNVTFLVRDLRSNLVLTTCSLAPEHDETNLQYLQLLPFRWEKKTKYGGDCNANVTPIVQKKGCADDGKSCTIKTTIAPATTGAVKSYARICCYEGGACTGAKLTAIPIAVDVEVANIACDNVPNVDPPVRNCDLSTGDAGGSLELVPQVAPSAEACRSAIGAAMTQYITEVQAAVAGCTTLRLVAGISPACAVADVDAALRDPLVEDVSKAADKCAPTRSPASLRFQGICPAPCDGINPAKCSAGQVGLDCLTDEQCNTSTALGDGRCGDWTRTVDCLLCLTDASISDTSQLVWGDYQDLLQLQGRAADPAVVACLYSLGTQLAEVASVRAAETAKCQKIRDKGQRPLPSSPCAELDLNGAIAAAEQKAHEAILAGCDPVNAAPVLAKACGGTANDFTQLADCVTDEAAQTNDEVTQAAFRENSSYPLTFVAPAFGTLSPCQPAVKDLYTFSVNSGDSVLLVGDTDDPASAADLCFGPGSGCLLGDAISGDEELPCSSPVPLGHRCPVSSFTATADDTCTVEVTNCSGTCVNPTNASYKLHVTRNSQPTVLVRVADDQP